MRFLFLLIFLTGCSPLDAIPDNPFKKDKGINTDVELTVGDKREEIATGAVIGKRKTVNTTNTADVINNNQQYYAAPDDWISIWAIFQIALGSLLVGWLVLPDASKMWSMISSYKK